MQPAASPNPLLCALDFASNWEIRGGVWRYGIELTRALVKLLGPEAVLLPVYDRLPPERLEEVAQTGGKLIADGWHTRYDRLEAMAQRNGRFIPWKTVLPLVYGPKMKQRLFRSALGQANVCHAIFTCRGTPKHGVTVGTIHDLIPLLHETGAGFSKERFLSMIEDHRRWATLVIVPSEATKSDLIKHLNYPADQIRVVYHGIDTGLFHPNVALPDELLKKHDLKPGQFLLYVGALERRKNIERLIEAYHAAVGDRRDMPLVLSGSVVHDLPRLKEALGDGSGRVRHIGYVTDDDLPGLYRAARALVHVAVAEGFGFTPPEAMACGTPVVTARQTATGEVVGEAGLLVDAFSINEIAKGIRTIIGDNAVHAQLSSLGKIRAAGFTWRRCAEQTYAVYQEAWQRRSPT
ncbi:MAG: glycosyltransferase family 1 protein [Gemmatales bacterium]